MTMIKIVVESVNNARKMKTNEENIYYQMLEVQLIFKNFKMEESFSVKILLM